jgi:mannose-6-phosphate isomerase-like protein (cupin superfamily)
MQKTNEHEQECRDGDHGVKYFFRGPNTDWGVILLLSGDALGAHFHNVVEETFYFLSGSPTMVVNGEKHRVKPGDVFRLEPEDTHDIINDTEEPAKMVFIKCPFDKTDKVSC